AYRRTRAAEALRRQYDELNEQRRATLESLREGVLTMDRSGAIVAWNPAALEFLGVTADELQGSSRKDPRWHFVNEDGSPVPANDFSSARVL
ncbi:PAS domain-containing protein, partial [Acinetobacter baumannii]